MSNTEEIYTILSEECAEVIQAICKVRRFGSDQILQTETRTNMQRLECELGDLSAMIDLIVAENIGITHEGIKKANLAKLEKLKKWSNIFNK